MSMHVDPTFRYGELVRKKSGSKWQGKVVGEYSTALTHEGYAVESSTETGSVQIYPVSALEPVPANELQLPLPIDALNL